MLCVIAMAYYATAQLSGKYSLGQGGDYSSVGAFLIDIQNKGLSGPAIGEILPGSNITSLTISSQNQFQYPVTIRPSENFTDTITLSLLRFVGCKNVFVDGRPGGAIEKKSIIVRNSVSINSAAIDFDGSVECGMQYIDVRSNFRQQAVIRRGAEDVFIKHCYFSVLDSGFINTGDENSVLPGFGISVEGGYKGKLEISSNKFVNIGVQGASTRSQLYAIRYGPGKTNPNHAYITNNYISYSENVIGDSIANIAAIWINGDSITVAHNSIYIDGKSLTNGNSFGVLSTSTNYLYIVNNIFQNEKTNLLASQAVNGAYSIPDTSSFLFFKSENNSFKVESNDSVAKIGSNYYSLSGLKTIGNDSFSFFNDINFSDPINGSLDLPANYSSLYNLDGKSNTMIVDEDIRGVPRSLSTPVLGAFEGVDFRYGGVYSVGSSGYFNTIDEAFDSLAIYGHKSNVILELEDDYTYLSTLSVPKATTDEDYNTIIRLEEGAKAAYFNRVSFRAAKNLYFDGSTGSEGSKIYFERTSTSRRAPAMSIGNFGDDSYNINFIDCHISSLGGRPFEAVNVNHLNVEKCNIYIKGSGPTAPSSEGIMAVIINACGNVNFSNNVISGGRVSTDGDRSVAIFNVFVNKFFNNNTISFTNNYMVLNLDSSSTIRNVQGIYVVTGNASAVTGSVCNIIHNTILLKGAYTFGEYNIVNKSAVIELGGATDSVNILNNILINEITDTSSSPNHVIYSSNLSSSKVNIDYNNIILGDTSRTGRISGIYKSFSELITDGYDINSKQEAVTFADANNLDLTLVNTTGLSLPGTPINDISADIFGNQRSQSNPSMGAYEIGGIITLIQEEVEDEKNIFLYPIPSNSLIYCTEKGIFTITGSSGALQLNGVSNGEPITIESLNPGLYFFRINGKTQRFIKL